MPEIWRSRARFEPEKPYFDATPHYRFGSLKYDVIARKIPSKLTCNSLTQASCKGSENSQHCSCPKMGVSLNSFLFAHFYLFFLFRYPLP